MKRTEITLTTEEQKELKGIISKGSSRSGEHRRARILLMADKARKGTRGGEGSNQATAQALEVSPRTVLRVKQRFNTAGLQAALNDKPRTGRPPIITGDIEARLVSLACSTPPQGRARWTLQLLADKMVELGYIDTISDVGVMKRLKKTGLDLGK